MAGRADVFELSPDSQGKARTPPDPRRLIADLARRQHGVVTLAQLLRCGVGAGAIDYRVTVGSLHRIHRGVFAVGYQAPSPRARSLAAVLAIGDGAVLSHLSAAVLWGLADRRPGREQVTVARRTRSRDGIQVHCVRRLDPRERTREDGIPVTTVARTLLDLAEVAPPKALRRALRQAYVQRRVDERGLRAVLDRAHGRRGAARLAALLAPGPVGTRSELEDRFLDLLAAHHLPRPRANVTLEGVEADFLFAEARLVVETDGARFHDNPIAREDDAARQAMLEAAGYRVLRVTWAQVTRRPAETARRVRGALDAPR